MTERLLLDTCAIIWIALKQPIKPDARDRMRAAGVSREMVGVSPISAWELGLLRAKDRLATTRSPIDLFDDVINTEGVRVVGLSPEILIESSFLPGSIHSDPADRILIATARKFDLTLMTRDRTILHYAKQGHVRAFAC